MAVRSARVASFSRRLGSATGEHTPREYTQRPNDLRSRETAASNELRLLSNRIDTLREVEADPIRWYDRITPPIARTEFPW